MAGIRGSIFVLFAYFICQILAQSCAQLGGSGTSVNDSKGNAYILACNKDLAWVGDITSIKATSFNSCFDLCTANADCRMFSYNVGKCWLQTVASDPSKKLRDHYGVDIAWRPGQFDQTS